MSPLVKKAFLCAYDFIVSVVFFCPSANDRSPFLSNMSFSVDPDARRVLEETSYKTGGNTFKVFEKPVPSIFDDRFLLQVSGTIISLICFT